MGQAGDGKVWMGPGCFSVLGIVLGWRGWLGWVGLGGGGAHGLFCFVLFFPFFSIFFPFFYGKSLLVHVVWDCLFFKVLVWSVLHLGQRTRRT